MKAAPSRSAPAAKPRRVIFPLLLAVLLAVLFWKCFLPGFVQFSNDGPLGQQVAAWAKLPAGLTGIWGDLNDIGSSGGSFTLDLDTLFRWLVGSVGYSKFLAPFAMFILGLGAWTFFRQLKLSPLAAVLGGLAAGLQTTWFSNACWGVASQQIAVGMTYFALALVVSNTPETPGLVRWTRMALAGLAVGMNVMEGADNGAIFSVFIAAFILIRALLEEGKPVWVKLSGGVTRVAVVAVFAAFIAAQAITSLVGVAIVGVAGAEQTPEAKAKNWDFATQWSLPKVETLSLFVPGLFGYRMDTPNNASWLSGFLQDSYQGGNYWGATGRDPGLDQYFADGAKGPMPPHGFLRQTGGGNYQGIVLAVVAFWAAAQSFRRKNSVFSDSQRKILWFWSGISVLAILMAWGRFAPPFAQFYKLFYMYIPYSSAMRNPTKFIGIFSWASLVLFAYGVHGLSRRYLEAPAASFKSSIAQLQSWWAGGCGFDRRWAAGSGVVFAVCVLAWLIYAVEQPALIHYLQVVGFGADMAKDIAAFSIAQAGWFLVIFALALGLVILIMAGIFSGNRARLGGILLGVLLVGDLVRADLPYVVFWNYPQKYASDPIINILRNKPYEHRAAYLLPYPLQTPPQFELFDELYKIEWVQQLFPYYNIQSLDLVMRPRVGSDLETYEMLLSPLNLLGRHWQLTNTRYLLGPADFLDSINQMLDPGQHRFHILQRFTIVPKPGVAQPTSLAELAAAPDTNGPYALFDFAGALPRAKLYSNWQVCTNDAAALKQWHAEMQPMLPEELFGTLTDLDEVDQLTIKTLTSTNFDPWQSVLLATNSPVVPNPPTAATKASPGTVEFTSYAPTDIKLKTQAATPTALLLNDQYDPNWRVTVDGQFAPLLRANFIMRGVYLPAGEHTVEFRFSVPHGPLYVTLAGTVVGIVLCGFLAAWTRRRPAGQK